MNFHADTHKTSLSPPFSARDRPGVIPSFEFGRLYNDFHCDHSGLGGDFDYPFSKLL